MKSQPAAASLVRHQHRGQNGNARWTPRDDHEALVKGRTIFPSTVKDPEEVGDIFKDGHHNSKIGRKVTKGKWKGFPIYTLTLEERKTCPRSCTEWATCYGNNMHLSQRWKHGPDLELYMELELRDLAESHPKGFVVRLHVLGDFYSVAYVRRWHLMMTMFENLHVFGFTARNHPDGEITQAIAAINREFPDRWMIRFSDADMPRMAATVIERGERAPEGFITCPQQTGKTLCCATCALCWHSRKSIAFVRH